jgi:hypothetical protein
MDDQKQPDVPKFSEEDAILLHGLGVLVDEPEDEDAKLDGYQGIILLHFTRTLVLTTTDSSLTTASFSVVLYSPRIVSGYRR